MNPSNTSNTQHHGTPTSPSVVKGGSGGTPPHLVRRGPNLRRFLHGGLRPPPPSTNRTTGLRAFLRPLRSHHPALYIPKLSFKICLSDAVVKGQNFGKARSTVGALTTTTRTLSLALYLAHTHRIALRLPLLAHICTQVLGVARGPAEDGSRQGSREGSRQGSRQGSREAKLRGQFL